jgi:NAD(P)-dependent dehydrogenase (short-subunit alcohol dehydrogenase family)
LKADVASWKEQLEVFKAAEQEYGKIDHVFANAGIGKTMNLLDDGVDENGDVLPPTLNTININLIGVIYTVKLAIHYIKKNPNGGSIVMTASVSSFTRFPAEDYSMSHQVTRRPNTNASQATAKHGVLGLLRALQPQLHPKLPIRINAIAPSWTDTGIVPRAIVAALGEANIQSADVVARSVALLMADNERHGELVYSETGKFMEIENGKTGYHAFTQQMMRGVEIEEKNRLSAAGKRVDSVINEMSEKERQHHTNGSSMAVE